MIFKKIGIKRQIAIVTKTLYSGEFDLHAILLKLGNPASNSKKLLQAYIIIQAVANSKVSKRNIDLNEILRNIDEYVRGETSDINIVMALLETKTQKALLEAQLEYHIEERAPEWSLEGIVFLAEKNKGGPLTERELNKLNILHKKLSEAESQLELGESTYEVSLMSNDSNPNNLDDLKDSINSLKEALDSRRMQTISELDNIWYEVKEDLMDMGIISGESTFFPQFKEWCSLSNHATLEHDEAVVAYVEEFEQAHKEYKAASFLGVKPNIKYGENP